jgi:hypothetical protein
MNNEQCPDDYTPKNFSHLISAKAPSPALSNFIVSGSWRKDPFPALSNFIPANSVVGFRLRILARSPDDQRDSFPGALHYFVLVNAAAVAFVKFMRGEAQVVWEPLRDWSRTE